MAWGRQVYLQSGTCGLGPNSFLEIKQEFEENCSVQVYSVQACIPKDPAVLWNAEFVQAEELFNQPSAVNNCLRDNRFCGVSNSFVKRNAHETPAIVVPPQPRNVGVTGLSKSNSTNQTLPAPFVQGKVQHESPKIGVQSSTAATKDVKSESSSKPVQASEPNIDKEKITTFPANKRKGQNDKRTGGSLATFWGRASAKLKPNCPPAETNSAAPNPVVTAEAQICAREAVDNFSSDEDEQDVKPRRISNGEGSRKRRVVFDFSDEEDDYENAVSLASPDPPPQRQSSIDDKHNNKTLVLEKNNMNFEEKEEKSKIKQEKATKKDFILPQKEDTGVPNNGKKGGILLSEKIHNGFPESDGDKKDTTNAAPMSPKRRKVLKTRIDERGREVTEVVWEGEETETKNADKDATKNSVNRAPAVKSPALGGTAPSKPVDKTSASGAIAPSNSVAKSASGGSVTAPSNPASKAGNKKTGKAGVKDAKQGNILSFFKRV
uniref:DNA polymerase delta subunit 3 n=1 Tax=Nelumbo nucifera TaxID=4432 RepID=A0A822Z8F4_NELNU|nr:TPA_asm: hypothetical protein HUJ06_008419 [Nelumbo nucifera]